MRETEPTPEEIKQLSKESSPPRPQQTEGSKGVPLQQKSLLLFLQMWCLIQVNLFYGLSYRNKTYHIKNLGCCYIFNIYRTKAWFNGLD
ncbi:MAG: hypothetical protein WBF33_36525 [Candidatus Nitrosopolaris sp.]